jgi:hypothetical protein
LDKSDRAGPPTIDLRGARLAGMLFVASDSAAETEAPLERGGLVGEGGVLERPAVAVPHAQQAGLQAEPPFLRRFGARLPACRPFDAFQPIQAGAGCGQLAMADGGKP